ncbi:MAG: TonB-dependent receptor, partial [Rhodothermia bacterium]|nr:TonB-dependent receptor [Rhodothermia bacterium]
MSQFAAASPHDGTAARDSAGAVFVDEIPATSPVFMSKQYVSDETKQVTKSPDDAVEQTSFELVRQHHSPLRPVSEIISELIGSISPEAGRSSGIPVLRGASAKRVVVTYDGIPLTHSAMREGPSLLPLAVVDQSAVSEVVYGWRRSDVSRANPGLEGLHLGSVLDDAMDQVVATPRRIQLSQQFSSADRGWSGRISGSGQVGRLRYHLGGLGRILGNLRAGSQGDNTAVQPYTGLRESTVHALASLRLNSNASLRAGLLSGWRDRSAITSDLEALRLSRPPSTLDVLSPRQMTIAYLSARYAASGLLRSASASVWLNRQRETMTVRRPEWGKTMFDDDRITIFGFQGHVTLAPSSKHAVTGSIRTVSEGIDAQRKEVRDEEVTFYQRGRFPGGTYGQSLAVQVQDSWSLNPSTTVLLGTSWSLDRRRSDYGPSVFGSPELIGVIDRTFSGLSWHAGVSHEISERTLVTGTVRRTFTAPGLDDIAANAFWFAGRDVPNPDVEGERSLTYEMSLRTGGTNGSRLALSAYRTGYRNLLSRTWYNEGPDNSPGTNDDLFRFTNANASQVTGLEVDGTYPVAAIGSFDIGLMGVLRLQHVAAPATTPRFIPPALYRISLRLERGDLFVEPHIRGAA